MKPPAERWEHWPYTQVEADRIRDYFDPPSRHALSIAAFGASTFVDLHDPERKKPNVRRQVERLDAAVTKLRRALSGLTGAAEAHLVQHCTAGIDGPISTAELHRMIHRFATENRQGFLVLPAKTKGGNKEQLLEKSLVQYFDKAFVAGHGGVRPKNGFPGFLRLCRDPLVRMRLLLSMDDKSLQKKGRRNRPQNRGD